MRPATSVLMVGVDRRFGSVVALDGAGLEVREGEVHAVLGENGAGKTSLMRILAGLDAPDDGEVVVGGRRVERFDPFAARRHGVAIVQQHFTLVPTLTAADNVTLARPLSRLRAGRGEAEQRLAALVDEYGLAVTPGVRAGELSVGEQQRLEVLRALDADPRVLVLDEPTALLTDREAGLLLDVCRRLADEGRSVVIVTHRMADVAAAADRVTVLRQARTVLSGEDVGNRTKTELARLMVGDDAPASIGTEADAVPAGVGNPVGGDDGSGIEGGEAAAEVEAVGDGPVGPRRGHHRAMRVGGGDGGHPSGPVLRVSGLTLGRLRDASFTVGAGQVVGVAGVDGNGQAELEAALSGRTPAETGTVELDGEELTLRDPGERIAAGIAYITSDRYRWGLVRQLDLADNLHLGRLPRWLPSRRARRAAAGPELERWDVRGNGPATRAGALSGGNAQKVVLARELGGDVRLVLACHATRGLDPEAASTVARRVLERADGGAGVVWVGAELDELFAVADALLVAVDGRLVGPFHPPYRRHEIGLVMAGEGTAGGSPAGAGERGGATAGERTSGEAADGELEAAS